MVDTSTIDWDNLNSKLPYEKTDEQKEKRRKLFEQFNPNNNGYVSLAEAESGIRNVLAIDELFDAKPAIHKAFHFAKGVNKDRGNKVGRNYIDFTEFRIFLQTLRQYFEYYQAFARIDSGDDSSVSKEEFVGAKEAIEKWVGPVEDINAEFDKMDTNGGGQVLFKEFVDWALKKNLDLEDDKD